MATKKITLGYRQEYPEGKFIEKTKEATVVSAYYEMPSKHSINNYKEWIRLFLESIPCYLVFFTEEPYREFIEDCRRNYKDKTHIIILDRSLWKANKFEDKYWKNQQIKDDERELHKSIDLYKIWYEKKEFVKRAIELNPFNHEDFVWTDAGFIGRRSELISLVKEYPKANRIPTNRILMLNYWPFSLKDNTIKNDIMGGGSGRPRIQGAIIAGHKDMWKKYDILYDKMIEKYNKADLFTGKDQTIMASITLENRDFISLLELKPISPESWFYLVLWLGVNDNLYSVFSSNKTNTIKKTYKELALI